MLSYWKMEPVLVESTQSAIEILSEKGMPPFEYILLDTDGMGGFAMAKFLNEINITDKTSIIAMLSSTAQKGVIEQHAGLSISVYLNKPIGQYELLETLLKPFKPQESHNLVDFPGIMPESKTNNSRILLAEDNPVNQQLAIKVLEKLGYNVELAKDGREAVAIAEKKSFDLILMDVQMPDISGFEATKEIREMESKLDKRTPIIAMTAHAIQGYREKCLEGGMDGYISKPMHIDALKSTLEEFLSQSQMSKRERDSKFQQPKKRDPVGRG